MPCKAVQRKVTDELGKYQSTLRVLEQIPVTLTHSNFYSLLDYINSMVQFFLFKQKKNPKLFPQYSDWYYNAYLIMFSC